jgi:hypothetical protein
MHEGLFSMLGASFLLVIFVTPGMATGLTKDESTRSSSLANYEVNEAAGPIRAPYG